MDEAHGAHGLPPEAVLRLDVDVAGRLHELADRCFGGDVNAALNGTLRAVFEAEDGPADPWAHVQAQVRSRMRDKPARGLEKHSER